MKISEYVSVGHPDKVADYISEFILDWFLGYDKNVRYAVECQIKDNHVSLAGEISNSVPIAWPTADEWRNLVVTALGKIGYTREYCAKWGTENTIDPSQITVDVYISQQSRDIAQGVNNDGWGDQGIFWGMAYKGNADKLPWDYYWAQWLCQRLYVAARDDNAPWGLDIKTQIICDDDNVLQKVIVAAPCKPEHYAQLKSAVQELVEKINHNTPEIIVNGTGAYVTHASIGDCGTTGRKLVVDFYGGNCRIGGGSPWTKDPTKADLTLNLLAREIAVATIHHTDMSVAYVSIGCCIGRKDIDVTIYDEHNNVVKSYTCEQSPEKTIKQLGLREPIYADMCMDGLWSGCYGKYI